MPENRLREVREAMGLSRAGLADQIGVSERQVRRWEDGEVHVPTKYLPLLAKLLDSTADHLLGLDRESERQRV